MPTMQHAMRTSTGMTRSMTRPRSFFASASVASSIAPRSGSPAEVAASWRFIGPKSNFMNANANMATIVRIA